MLSSIFLKLQEHWGRRLEKQAPLSNCGEKTASAEKNKPVPVSDSGNDT